MGVSKSEIIKVTSAFFLLIIPFIIAQLWWWVAFWLFIALFLGCTEFASLLKDEQTISKKFWIWKETAPKWQKFLIFGGMIGFWTYLVGHLFLGW